MATMVSLPRLLGESPAIDKLREQVGRLLQRQAESARRRAPILILGETGTGKGLLASDHPRDRAPPGRAVRRRQLRRHPRHPARGGAVRLRAGRLHRCAPGQGGPLPDGAPRHPVPRRGGTPAGGSPGEAAQGARGANRAAPRKHAQRSGRRLADRRHEREPGRGRSVSAVPGGSLSSPGGGDARAAAAPRAGRGHSAARRALSAAGPARTTDCHRRRSARMPGRRSRRTPGPATSASWRTWSSASRFSRTATR